MSLIDKPILGPGSFFKAHKDTPRAGNMIGSLVVVYPTAHEGGALIFRHKTQEHIFDSATAVTQATSPSIAYAVFYSDLQHEVDVVRTGYRVTLTYNIYLRDGNVPIGLAVTSPYETALKNAFIAMIRDQSYLPKGGLVGFGLRHEYPVAKNCRSVVHLVESLKGTDAILMKVCKDLGLTADLWMVYEEAYYGGSLQVLCPRRMDLHAVIDEESWSLMRDCGGKVIKIMRDGYTDESDFALDEIPKVDVTVNWATEMAPANVRKTETAYGTYGNEPGVGYAYGSLCLIVQIARADRRNATKTPIV